jgi:hypothetical protein
MIKFKAIITALLFVASCVALVAADSAVSAILVGYSASFPTTLGTHVPAFTSTSLAVMSNSASICFGTLVASLVLAFWAMRRVQSRESKLYWITSLSSINFYLSTFVLSTTLIGFFLLPKLANGT